jgi:hypothetical protein
MAANTRSLTPKTSSAALSAWIIAAITLVALLAGWGLRQSVQGLSVQQQRQGISAAFPKGWMIEKPIESTGKVFTARAALDPTLTYTIGLEPSTQNLQLSDLAYNRNLKRAQALEMYAVLDQQNVLVNGKAAYKVHFAYVQANDAQSLPVVIEGVDYYFAAQPKALVVTLEEETSLFNEQLPRFMQFLDTVSQTPGGAQ